ncbi:MAG TPA: HNH endonuclease [Candidatus Binatia bacterium]|nr:HNH endonuclease [Candidatus Binatia bacterium]
MGRSAANPIDRYLSKVDRGGADECWPWTAACFTNGYGAFRVGNKQLKAHRFGYAELIAPIPVGLYVCHTCDNRPCQNPAHWFLGTTGDNARDREAKGRGARNGKVRFQPEQVREMRLLGLNGVTQAEIANRFETQQSSVSQILRRKTFAHLDTDLPAWKTSRRYKVTPAIADAVLAERGHGLTMNEIGERHGVSRATVRHIIRGWRPLAH